ncbi:MAG: hypothetical protein M1828_002252 [Chrysothrix sp. TS-e1954]|nr:MAG: hypothetical protein M1828_002252 [Chrysothrix sp. TS-e1954]
MAAVAIDVPYLSSYTSVPEPSLETLINNPTTDLVTSFLQTLVEKAQDHDRLKSERLRQDVELENAVRAGDTRAKGLKSTADNALQEVESLRKQINDRETAYTKLESQLQSLQSSSTTSTTEVQTLHSQIKKLEQSNRDTLSLLSNKSTAHDEVAKQLQSQHENIIKLRRDAATSEEHRQTADNNLSAAKFHESSLESEIGLLRRSNDWLDGELKTKSSEYSKYRKDKSAKISELQRLNDDSTSSVQSLRRTEGSLRKRLEEIEQKLDESYLTNQQLREDIARKEDDLRSQADGARRVADLQKQSLDTVRRRLQEVENEAEKVKEEAVGEVSRLQTEVETERNGREQAEQQVEELETTIEKLEARTSSPAPAQSIPGTPRASVNGLGSFGTPGRAGSPLATPSSARGRGGLTFTQLYAEYHTMKADLEGSKRRNEKLSATIDEMIHDMEQKGPEFQEQQLEIARLEIEVENLSARLDEAGQERDIARRESRNRSGEADLLTRESNLMRQQLRDLSTQIRVLLLEAQLRSEGAEYSSAERQQMERLARGEDDDVVMEGMTDTDRFISQRLVSFKTIFELQENNATLLNLTRKLGEQMEGEEAQERKAQQEQDRMELEHLRQRVETYQDEMKSLVTQSQSYIRERNMLKNIIANRGQLPPNGDMTASFGSSVNVPATPQTPQPGTQNTPRSQDAVEFAKALKEMQSHFDGYREEAATDRSTLTSQLQQLQKDKNSLQSELARASSQLTLARERYEMLQSNFSLSKNECEEYQKRSHSLADAAAKQDLKTQQVAEDLVEAKGLSESLRNENANLKAEKDLWKRVEARITEDNRSLVEERGRMNKTISDSQNLYNERELSDAETRRKLQMQVESLETDMRTVSRKMDEAVEEAKTANTRREYDQDQNRTRIDDLIKSLGQTKEDLAAAKTNRDQLQARVDELKIELRSAQEHAQALQPRPTPRPETSNSSSDAQHADDNGLSREQELEIEISDVKRDLDLAKAEFESAKSQVEQYQAISQSAEEELQSLNGSYDEYREDSEKVVNEKDSKIRELDQRVNDIFNELSETNQQLSELRASSEDNTTRLTQQKAGFDAEFARIKDECERLQETSNLHQEDLRAQADIAQQAQNSYDHELVKHAEAAKALQKVRSEYNQMKLEFTEAKTEAQAARVSLSQSEESWTTTKDQYEQEILELKRRRDDISSQNRLLHQQLESVGSQIADLQKKRASDQGDDDVPLSTDSGMQNLQEVINFLRREKSIIDVQYEMSVQEARRFKQQLDYTQSQLDDTRLKLDQEREAHSSQEKTAMGHSKLMDTINELNVFRESSVTLRNEARQAQSQLSEKAKRVEELMAQMEPMQISVRTMETEHETIQGEMKLLQEDRDRWQKRTQDILQKYDRIDPAELQSLKDQVAQLESSKDEATQKNHALQEEVNSITDQVTKAREDQKNTMESEFESRRNRLTEDLKKRGKEWTSRIKTLQSENTSVQESLRQANVSLEEAQQARDEAVSKLEVSQAPKVAPVEGDAEIENAEEGQVGEDSSGVTQDAHHSGDGQAAESAPTALVDREKISQLTAEVETLHARNAELDGRVRELEQQLSVATSELADLRATSSNTEVEKLRDEIQAAQEQVRTLRDASSAQQPSDAPTNGSADEQKAYEVRRQELEDQHKARIDELEKTTTSRIQSMREQLTKKLAEGKAAYRTEIDQKSKEAMEEARKEHQNEIEAVRASQASASSSTAVASSSDAPSDVKHEERPTSLSDWQPTDEQAVELAKSNPTIRAHIRSSLNKRLEVETSKLSEEHQSQKAALEQSHTQQLKGLQEKAELSKSQAVELAGKKYVAKISMTENKARVATAKIEVVQKAATDTPQKPVVEVWALVKDYRPPPANQPSATSSSQSQPAKTISAPAQSSPDVQAAKSTTPVTNETEDKQKTLTAAPTEANGPQIDEQASNSQTAAPGPLSQAPRRLSQSVQGGIPQPTQSRIRRPSQSQPVSHQSAQQPNGVSANSASEGVNASGASTRGSLRGNATQGSGIPRGGTAGRDASRGGRGGPSGGPANEQLQSSKLPNAPLSQGQQPRGPSAVNTRGAGRGAQRGRGQTSQPPSPAGRGGMNAGARPFAPGGIKRPRNESDGAGDGANKRTRGGDQA